MNSCVFPTNASHVFTDLTSLQPGNASVHANSSTQSSQPPARNLSQVQNATIVQLPDDSRSAVYTEPLGQNASMHMQDIHDIESDDDEAPKPKYGKKTRGRVKVKMQFITNKLRRYTTFSKRKTGIMKKVNFDAATLFHMLVRSLLPIEFISVCDNFIPITTIFNENKQRRS